MISKKAPNPSIGAGGGGAGLPMQQLLGVPGLSTWIDVEGDEVGESCLLEFFWKSFEVFSCQDNRRVRLYA